MKLEQERLNDFQSRMNEWVSKQGLLFQLRYAGNVKGAESTFFHTLSQLFLRLLVLLVLVAIGFFWYLVKRVETTGFRTGLKESIVKNLDAEELNLKSVARKRGMLKVGGIDMIGGEKSAFEDLEIRGAQILMGLTDGLLKPWTGDTLEIDRLTAFVKGGANTDEAAAQAYESLFWSSDNLSISAIKVAEANLKWGYSKSNQGHVIGSKMVAKRNGQGWNVLLTGGTFSQNWFRNLSLERMELEISPQGFHIHEARMRKGAAEISFTLKKIRGGESPEFEGKGTINGVQLSDLIGAEYESMINGTVSANFEVNGSTNKQTGFSYLVNVKLQEGDEVDLMDNISLLRAISTADYLRSYRKVRLMEGGFRIRTELGKIEVDEIALVASRLMRLEGAFSIRPPTEDELPEELALTEKDELLGFGRNTEEFSENAFLFTLRKAAEAREEENEEEGSLLFTKNAQQNPEKELNSEARSRELQRVYLDGEVRLGILASSFERSPKLAEEFPVDEARGLRWLTLAWDGESPSEIGDELAKKIFDLGAAVSR